jgi:hypothetical protein
MLSAYIHLHHVPPPPWPAAHHTQAPEKKEEQGLRERMTHLLARVQDLQRAAAARPGVPAKSGRHRATQQEMTQAAKESNIEIISAILGAMEQVGHRGGVVGVQGWCWCVWYGVVGVQGWCWCVWYGMGGLGAMEQVGHWCVVWVWGGGCAGVGLVCKVWVGRHSWGRPMLWSAPPASL